MTVELIGELNSDLHPMYLYLTFYVALFYSYGLFRVTHYQLASHDKIINNSYHASFRYVKQAVWVTAQWQDMRSWLSHKMKRKASPDDDDDNHTFSYGQPLQLSRGGQTCILYSLSLKNIVLSVSLS